MIGICRNLLIGACCVTLIGIATDARASGLSTHSDPIENAYTLDLPTGWTNQLGIRRTNGEMQVPRQWATAISPDGQTRLFVGDTNIPFFQSRIPQQVLANAGMPEQQVRAFFANFLRQKGIVMLPYQSAERFASDYAKRRFGRESGFRIIDAGPNPALAQAIAQQNKKLGVPPVQTSSGTVRFEYTGHTGTIWANTSAIPGEPDMWSAGVSGFTTAGDNAAVSALFARAAVSLNIDKAWLQAERQRASQRNVAIQQRQMQQNQQRMRNSNTQHQARMQAQRNSFNAHQARMAGNAAVNDQRNQAWSNNQNNSYQQHQAYIRGINEQTLVSPSGNSYGSGGNSYEVDAGYNNYYVDELNNQYIGTDQPFDAGQLPDGYRPAEEASANW